MGGIFLSAPPILPLIIALSGTHAPVQQRLTVVDR